MKNILLVSLLLLAVHYIENISGYGKYIRKQNQPIQGLVLCSEFTGWCPAGYQCILWENTCKQRPCRVFPICRPKKELVRLFETCKKKGCPEDECVLMQSTVCKNDEVCLMNPNCTATSELRKCRGFICPNGYGCEVRWPRCMTQPCLGTVYCFLIEKEEKKLQSIYESRFRLW